MTQTLMVSRDSGEPVTITFGEGDLTAEQIQARIDEAVGPGALRVVTDADRERGMREEREALRNYRPTEDRAGWVKASWDSISGGEPSRLRRFHASGCQWNPATRKWSCEDECNVPRWTEEEAADDD